MTVPLPFYTPVTGFSTTPLGWRSAYPGWAERKHLAVSGPLSSWIKKSTAAAFCQQVCAHALTFAQVCEMVQTMLDMGRDRKPINLTLDPEVVRRLDAWIEQQPIRAGRSAVVESAIKAFLDGQEFPTKKGKSDR